MREYDALVIGAGPSGSVSSALLNKAGHKVCVLEKERFPRFVIGESLLPHCMEFLRKADMEEAVNAASEFQFKNGAAFTFEDRYTEFDFTDKFTPGPGTTLQVKRAHFDHILIDEAEKQGVEVNYGIKATSIDFKPDFVEVRTENEAGDEEIYRAKFILDASGYGRILPRLLDLETPSELPERMAYFTHIDDNVDLPEFDREKILVSVHPRFRDVWIWFIPFADNRTSIGVVGTPERLRRKDASEPKDILQKFVYECKMLNKMLDKANWDNEVPYRSLRGYSANVKRLYGDRYALLGNATEFLDPVFSSGVTIALHSADCAATLVDRQLRGEKVDWQKEYADPLMVGVNAFRTYVNGWYSEDFQEAIFSPVVEPKIKRMICAILAGYAWDSENPYVAQSDRRLKALAEVCRSATAGN
jgi:flavin-dependent dehydrogenase